MWVLSRTQRSAASKASQDFARECGIFKGFASAEMMDNDE